MGIYKVNAQAVKYDSISCKKYVSVDVPKTYERIIAKGYETIEMFEYLGDYYFKINNFEKSKLYFDILFKKYSLSQISPKSIDTYRRIKLMAKS